MQVWTLVDSRGGVLQGWFALLPSVAVSRCDVEHHFSYWRSEERSEQEEREHGSCCVIAC
jgi:hypothetical protein